MDTNTIVSELEDIKESLRQVHECLIGNEYTRNRGLIDEVADFKKRLNVVELFVKKSQWLIGLAAGCGGVVGFLIQMLAQYLLSTKK